MVLVNLDQQLELSQLDEIKTAILLSVLNVMVTVRKGKRVQGNGCFDSLHIFQCLL